MQWRYMQRLKERRNRVVKDELISSPNLLRMNKSVALIFLCNTIVCMLN